MIHTFNSFVSERYQIGQNDKPETASKKAQFNDIESWVMQYRTHRQDLDNIYMTYTSQEDLRKKLQNFQQKMGGGSEKVARELQLQANPKNPKTFQFLNPLFGIHSQISAKKRQLKIKEMDLEKQKQTIADREKSSGGKEDLEAAYAVDIESTQDKIGTITEDLKKIQQEITDLERQVKKELKAMVDKIRINKAAIDAQLRQDTTT
jgi:hypothetical protein